MQIAYMPYKFSFCCSSETTVKMTVKKFILKIGNHYVKNTAADSGRLFDMMSIICELKWLGGAMVW